MPRRRPPPPGSFRSLADSLYPTLDLHGNTADEARARIERWLIARREEGERNVRIVTGRGMHSVGPPVLRAETEHLLQALKGTIVSSFEREIGGGAIRVELRKLSLREASPSVRARPSTRPLDPVLRREAEESLVELGVDPTPALVEAEMERLARERRSEE